MGGCLSNFLIRFKGEGGYCREKSFLNTPQFQYSSSMNKRYIGDGVYAEVENGQVKLTTETDEGLQTIYLDSKVLESLNRFVEDMRNPDQV